MNSNLVPDRDVLVCRRYFPYGAILHMTEYQMHFSFALGRNLSLDEVKEIMSRINGFGPHPYDETYEAVVRSSESFWKRPL